MQRVEWHHWFIDAVDEETDKVRCNFSFYFLQPEAQLAPEGWAEPAGAPPLLQECPGQSFQARHLLQYLKSSLTDTDDVLLEPYLQSWDQLLKYAHEPELPF